MRITQVELENIKSYRSATISLERGTTAIRGHNGAGKSTIVEAIGFALFGTKLSYNQSQFVREGEKTGTVTVSFLSALDDRTYQAVRKCGSNSAWYIYDPELDNRPAEQTVDVKDFLRKHLRIETEIELADLFNDAIGVPQGTFTADFLLTPTNRKKKFDALLQVEDYRNAADRLKGTVDYFKDEKRAIERRIDDLERETNQLDEWRLRLDGIARDERTLTSALAAIQREVVAVEARREALRRQEAEVARLEAEARIATSSANEAEARRLDAETRLTEAREAVAIREAARPGHEAHTAAQARLVEARRRSKTRDDIQRRHATTARALEVAESEQRLTEERRTAAHAAALQLGDLTPALRRQSELERDRDVARQRCTELAEARRNAERIERDRARTEADILAAVRRVAELDGLRPLAELLEKRRERLTMLQELRARRTMSTKRLAAVQAEAEKLARKHADALELEAKERNNVQKLLDRRDEPAGLPELQRRHAELQEQARSIQARIAHHRLSREQSGAGNCPFLGEQCLNIRRKGENSLATYFDRMIERDDEELAPLEARLAALGAEVETLAQVATYVARLPEYEERYRKAQKDVADLAEQLNAVAAERAEIEAFLAGCPDAAEVAEAQQEFKASDEADKELRELAPRQAELSRLRERQAALAADAEAHRASIAALEGAPAALEAAEAELAALGDPRQTAVALETIASGRAALDADAERLHHRVAELQANLAATERELAPFAALDAEIQMLDADIARTEPDHTRYLQHEQSAARLPEYQTLATEAMEAARSARRVREAAFVAAETARAAFDATELANVSQRADELGSERGSVTARLAQAQRDRETLTREIERVEALMSTLRAAREEFDALVDLEKMLQQFRDTIKEAGPTVMKALLRQISVGANRIFGEILGDRSGELSWEADYEIVLRRDGKERSFAQLSGGEQMSAALAVRLALLRSLTRLDLAFFDEPTQNMDGERRGNLAEQIRRVRGFDQLVVISHDDTFEQGLDSVIHLEKRNGETVLVAEDALVSV